MFVTLFLCWAIMIVGALVLISYLDTKNNEPNSSTSRSSEEKDNTSSDIKK